MNMDNVRMAHTYGGRERTRNRRVDTEPGGSQVKEMRLNGTARTSGSLLGGEGRWMKLGVLNRT